jgi:hypothetical protein
MRSVHVDVLLLPARVAYQFLKTPLRNTISTCMVVSRGHHACLQSLVGPLLKEDMNQANS